jgi:large subunit ribosomal protein L17
MNKKVFGRKLSRSRPAREALRVSLMLALIQSGKIVTTRAKAKAVIPDIEKMITLVKKGRLQERRKVLSMIDNSKVGLGVLFSAVVKAFSGRNSGFTRIVPLPRRVGDMAEMVRLEWTDRVEYTTEKKEEKKKNENKSEEPKKSVGKKIGVKKTK